MLAVAPRRLALLLLTTGCFYDHPPAAGSTGVATMRLRFWRYRFSEPGADGWWTREAVGETGVLRCADLPSQ